MLCLLSLQENIDVYANASFAVTSVGPLVTPTSPTTDDDNQLTRGKLAGIVVGVIIGVLLLLLLTLLVFVFIR